MCLLFLWWILSLGLENILDDVLMKKYLNFSSKICKFLCGLYSAVRYNFPFYLYSWFLGPGTIDPQPPKVLHPKYFKSVLLYEPFFVLDKWVLGSDLIYITIILYIIFTNCLHAYVLTSTERMTVSMGRYRGLSRSLSRVL